jgi:hypothetical protein
MPRACAHCRSRIFWGHSDPNFTLRTYTHTWEELHHEAADKMGAMLVATGAL